MLRFIKFISVMAFAMMSYSALCAETGDEAGDEAVSKTKNAVSGKAKPAAKGKPAKGKPAKGKAAKGKAAKAKPAAKDKPAANAKPAAKGKTAKKGKKAKKAPADKPDEKPETTSNAVSADVAEKDADEIFADTPGEETAADPAEEPETAPVSKKSASTEEAREPAEADKDDAEDKKEAAVADEDETDLEAPGDEGPPPSGLPARHRIAYSNLLVGRFNPIGVEDLIDIGYRYRLYEKTAPLFRDSYLGASFTPTINPTVSRIGVTLFAQPISILTLSAGYYFNVWYGTFGHLQSFSTATASHSDTRIKDMKDGTLVYGKIPPAPYNTTGHELQIGLNLSGMVGPVLLRSTNYVHFTVMNLKDRDGDGVKDITYYDPRYDVLVANRGWFMTSDLDALYMTKFGLAAGVRGSMMHAFYSDKHYLEGEPTDNMNTPALRAGLLVAYEIFNKPGAVFNKPTVFLNAGWWILHRFRTGEDSNTGADVSQAVPYLLLGFKFEGDIYRKE